MPELPEVETVCRALRPILTGRRLTTIDCRRRDLRVAIPRSLPARLSGRRVRAVERRAKYICVRCDGVGMLCHLGMTGIWRVRADGEALRTHDHVRIQLDDDRELIYNDPRRFGMIDLLAADGTHAALADLGCEPLSDAFTAEALAEMLRSRRSAIKAAVMDQRVVVGVGNIYAAEALFRAGIDPRASACRVTLPRLRRLVAEIRHVLSEAIAVGGSTIRDYRQLGGELGAFRGAVYDREGEPCTACATRLRSVVIAGRSSVWCPSCQKR